MSELSIVKSKSVGLFPFTSLLSSNVTTSSLLILDSRRFPVIVKTLDFDSLIGSLFESAQWRISSAEIFSESLSSGKLLKWADAARATRLHRIRRRPFADIFHPFHYTQHCYIFLSVSRTDTGRCPMVSFHSDPSLSDPTESVCRHFPPLSLLYLAVYFLRLSRTDMRRVRWTLATAIRLHWIRRSPLSTFFTPFTTLLCCMFSKYLAN